MGVKLILDWKIFMSLGSAAALIIVASKLDKDDAREVFSKLLNNKDLLKENIDY